MIFVLTWHAVGTWTKPPYVCAHYPHLRLIDKKIVRATLTPATYRRQTTEDPRCSDSKQNNRSPIPHLFPLSQEWRGQNLNSWDNGNRCGIGDLLFCFESEHLGSSVVCRRYVAGVSVARTIFLSISRKCG